MTGAGEAVGESLRLVIGGRARNAADLPDILAVVAAAAALTGCGSSGTHESHPARRGQTSAPAGQPAYDPPTAFAASRATPLPAAASQNTTISGTQNGPPPVALSGTTAFVTTGTSTIVIDTTTGRRLGEITPTHLVPKPPGQDQAYAGGAGPPALIDLLQGRPTALVGYVVQIPGHGTTPPALALEIDAIDTGAHRLWTLLTPLPGQPSDLTDTPGVTFAGSSGNAVVAAEGDSEDGYFTQAIDLSTRRLLWQNRAFLADATVAGTAIGTIDTSSPSTQGANTAVVGEGVHVASLEIRTGQTTWQQHQTLSNVHIQPSGPSTALLEATDNDGNDVLALLDTTTGKANYLYRKPAPVGGIGEPWTCTNDGRSTDVCSDNIDSPQAFALDANTGRTLWQLPDKAHNRIAPTVTTAWHGAVYGTTPSGPVVLDARSGHDLNDTPGAAPLLVDPYVGIANSENGLEAYPAPQSRAAALVYVRLTWPAASHRRPERRHGSRARAVVHQASDGSAFFAPVFSTALPGAV